MGSIETSKEIPSELTINKAKGKLTAEELLIWLSEYYSGITTKLILWDFNEADLSSITSEEFMEIAKEVKNRSDLRAEGKTAFVVNNDLGFGLGRMFQAFSEIEGTQLEFMSFRDVVEARKWLGLDV